MPNLYASVLSDEHQSILWKVCWHFWKWKLCLIQAPLLAVIEEGDIWLAAQHSLRWAIITEMCSLLRILEMILLSFTSLFCITRWEHSFLKGNIDSSAMHLCPESLSRHVVESCVCQVGVCHRLAGQGWGRCVTLFLSMEAVIWGSLPVSCQFLLGLEAFT